MKVSEIVVRILELRGYKHVFMVTGSDSENGTQKIVKEYSGMKSNEFADICLNKTDIALLVGTNFDQYGEGFVRMCYVNTEERIIEAIERIRKVLE